MFVWARIPDFMQERIRAQLPDGGSVSLEFSKRLLAEAKVAVSPGIGFGEYGDDHVRFGLIENEHRTRQAVARHQGRCSCASDAQIRGLAA